nr:MAG TPA: hypothetical protein [Caudoviricetes sp.]
MLLFVIDRLYLSIKYQTNNYKFKTSKIRLFTIFSRLFGLNSRIINHRLYLIII